MSHFPSWTNRVFPADVTRQQVLDNYNQRVSLDCPICNILGSNKRREVRWWMMSGLTEHLELYLGEIQEGWTRDADGSKMPFQVLRSRRGSGPGTLSFSTLGLSAYSLQSSGTGREIHHELLMIVPEDLASGPVPALLQQVGIDALTAGRALLRGDVIGPRGPLVRGSAMEALYVGMPVYLPDEFATYTYDDLSVVIAWLIPISQHEANYVALEGWKSFENRLATDDPNLTDINRLPLAL